MEFHDNYPQYELMSHHSEADGVHKRKKLWKVFWIMLVITLVELVIGFYADSVNRTILMVLFIGFTIMKAAYIVLSFMHLGDEIRALKYVILIPFSMFIIYLIWVVTTEGTYAGVPERKSQMDQHIVKQQQDLRAGHGDQHGTHNEAAPQKASETHAKPEKH